MTREQAKELMPIIQAFAEGKEVEIKTKEGSEWQILKENDMQYIDFRKCDLRIKPKYRPFKDAEECWQEIQKHKPLGWLKASHGKFFIIGARNDEVAFGINDNWHDYNYVFNNYTVADGTPFGIREE